MKILVTGGAGFIGSHIVDGLLALKHEVTIYDNFSTGRMDNLPAEALARGQLKIIKGDILDQKAFVQACTGHDALSHQAAQLEIFRGEEDPKYDLETNTLGTIYALKAAGSAGIRKIVVASSACVYGQLPCKDTPSLETDRLRPNWAYGISKLAAEKYCELHEDLTGAKVFSLRYGIVYGEREWYRRVLTLFVKRALLGEPLVIFGNGEPVRDFVHVSDVVAFHNECLLNWDDSKPEHRVFNVGSGRATSVAELAQAVKLAAQRLELPGIDVIHETVNEGKFSRLVPDKRRNVSELNAMYLDISRARAAFDWSPKIDLEAGLIKSLSWARNHLNRWDKIRYSDLHADSQT